MLQPMSRLIPALALALLLAPPVAAQEEGEGLEEGFGLMERGARIILRELLREMRPMLEELGRLMEDIDAYHLPEQLPNGDIIIRRKIPLLPPEEPLPPPAGEIEL